MRRLLIVFSLVAPPAFAQQSSPVYGPGPCPVNASYCQVTATGGSTTTSLANWFQGLTKSGTAWGIGVTPVSAFAIKDGGTSTLSFGTLGGNTAIAGMAMTGASSALISTSNYIIMGDGATTYTNASTTLSYRIANSEKFNVTSVGASVTGAYFNGGTQVLGARITGYSAMTGTPNKATVYDTSTVTLPQLAGRVAQLQADMTTHGMIGP